MKSNLKLVCQNGRSSVTFAYDWPFWIEDLDGVTSSEFAVHTQEKAGGDGTLYLGSQAAQRNIVITAHCRGTAGKPIEVLREELFSFFQPRTEGTLYFYEGHASRKIDYRVEHCSVGSTGDFGFRDAEISLICPDPVWKAVVDEVVSMAQTEGDIEFDAELPALFEVSHRVPVVMGTIYNTSNSPRGLTILFEATGVVVNPVLIEATRQEKLQVILTMSAGDVLTVTTGAGRKRVTLTSGGVTANINHKWLFGSVWLQAMPGKNLYRYTATTGESALSATIKSTPAYWGA